MAEAIGLHDLTDIQRQLISAANLSQIVSPTEAALHMSQIEIVRKSVGCQFVKLTPPKNRNMRVLERCNKVVMASQNLYTARPACLEDVPMSHE